ncbi:CPBP family intramembrane glutamic endopeptidase [methane-oxidizing endosymbiont of Gigantopelta aegis]|uniref:CPBP family intramembrane glutamic endopeptidase n=1 Tax=methane-oxidizing endosymbiont of Gigantopelta aegis TaxID=2794938 RepID=UPI0018DBA728|nr:CPBP family intramembrane glutamic endopeptidase [methane-oxidizing endosymbiont of Gigantopelta aegis]
MMRLLYAFLPLIILIILATVACWLGYYLLLAFGDVVEFRKIISKTTLVLLLLSIFPLKAWLKLSWQDLGFAPPRQFLHQMGLGLLIGIITLLPVLLVLYGLDVHIIDTSRDWTVLKACKRIGISLLLALLISFLEEPLFRGILLASLRQKLSLSLAVGLSAFYYASLHFLKAKSSVPYAEISPAKGFDLMLEAFANWFNPAIFSALLALWVVGVFLALIRIEFRHSLGICVGCHAGWVWLIKTSKDFLDVNPKSDYLFLVSGYDGVVGPLVTIWLSLAIAGYWLWKQRCTNP